MRFHVETSICIRVEIHFLETLGCESISGVFPFSILFSIDGKLRPSFASTFPQAAGASFLSSFSFPDRLLTDFGRGTQDIPTEGMSRVPND